MDDEEFPVLKYTVQLYYKPEQKEYSLEINNPRPEQIASGVLIKRWTKYYLLTCKHVFDNIKVDDIIILTTGGFAVRLPNVALFINDDKDSIDLALIQIKGARIKELKSIYSFLPYRNLGFKHEFDEKLFYMLYGFINKQTKLENYAFFVAPFAYLSTFRHYKKIEKVGFSYENNITLEYCRKQNYLDDNVRMLGYKDLKGLSGGGVWLSVQGRIPDSYNYVLVGIMIEERIERGFIIGTRIKLLENYI